MPITLHINRESRIVTLKHYTVLVPKDLPFRSPCRPYPHPREPLCLDLARDFIFRHSYSGTWCPEDVPELAVDDLFNKLKHLVVLLEGGEDLDICWHVVQSFNNLETLYIDQPQDPLARPCHCEDIGIMAEGRLWLLGNWPAGTEDAKRELVKDYEDHKAQFPDNMCPRLDAAVHKNQPRDLA